jgi:hypothetical protein
VEQRHELVGLSPEAMLWGAPSHIPSDAATDAEGRVYDVELHDVDDRTFHLRWGGRHAAATLAALRRGHRLDGPIRQVEWGSYEAVLDGGATRRLLSSVLSDDGWWGQQVEIVQHGTDRRPVVRGAGPTGSVITLAAALELLDDGRRYSVLADVY